MKCQRKGTGERIVARLQHHDALTKKHMAEGMTEDDASRRALVEMQAARIIKRRNRLEQTR